ncbi:MAG: hypothetical protein IJP65_04075, partial [Bacteroidales bacterium]|nr:hypothetical protein [Bacteroidales bacterium]
PKKRLFLHDYKVHRKPNPDTLDETLPWRAKGTRSQMHQSLRKHSSLMVIVEKYFPHPLFHKG